MMRVIEEKTEADISDRRDLLELAPGTAPLLIDIETTGLSPERAFIYLIGCGGLKEDGFFIRQFFAEDPGDERELLAELLSFASGFDCLVHFNGNRFDMPFIRERLKRTGLYEDAEYLTRADELFRKRSLDYYLLIKPYKKALGLPDCRQKSVERLIGTAREDETDGGELIKLYLDAEARRAPTVLNILLKHNRDDIRGLCLLSRVLDYMKLSDLAAAGVSGGAPFLELKDITKSSYRTRDDGEAHELILSFEMKEISLPALFSSHRDGLYLKIDGSVCKLRVPLTSGEMKLFYPDFKSYYYLPAEDMAIHKSVSQFVDKSRRERAVASNCYTRASGEFLPVFADKKGRAAGITGPLLRPEYGDSRRYVILKKETDMNEWLAHALSHIFSSK